MEQVDIDQVQTPAANTPTNAFSSLQGNMREHDKPKTLRQSLTERYPNLTPNQAFIICLCSRW